MSRQRQILLYVSELASLAGEETHFKSRGDAIYDVMKRNNMPHPDDKAVAQKRKDAERLSNEASRLSKKTRQYREDVERIAANTSVMGRSIESAPATTTISDLKRMIAMRNEARKQEETLIAKLVETVKEKQQTETKMKAAADLLRKDKLQQRSIVQQTVNKVLALEPATVAPVVTATAITAPSQAVMETITPEIRSEIRKELRSRAMQSSGKHYEAKDIARERPQAQNSQKGYSKCFCTKKSGIPFKIFGRIDAMQGGKLCEFKRRMNRLFEDVPHYELPQLYGYMVVTGIYAIEQIETYRDKSLTHDVTFDPEQWNTYLNNIDDAVEEMQRLAASANPL